MPAKRKITRFGIKCGKFVVMYERIINNFKPVKQVEIPKQKQLKEGGIDIYV